MKILLAADDSLSSRYAAGEAVNLAFNALADVAVLGLCGASGNGGKQCPPDGAMTGVLEEYRRMFLEHGPREENPYIPNRQATRWLETGEGMWEEFLLLRGARKELRMRALMGGPGEVLAEDARDEYDLIIVGCGAEGQNLRGASGATLLKLIESARASVLLVKQDRPIHKMACLLDRESIPQRSLEMINLLATIHKATLELLGVTREGWLKVDVDNKLSMLSNYFTSSQNAVLTGFKEHGQLLDFVSHESRPDLVVMWRGEKSILNRLFPSKWLGELVTQSQSSMLILR